MIDLDKLSKELGLTELQKRFCDYYVFVTGLNAELAVELSGYSVESTNTEKYDEKMIAYYKELTIKRLVRVLVSNPKILKYITAIRKELNNQLVVDKLWVINKLKKLADVGSENTQLKATELLGKTMEMFTDKKVIESVEDPSKIMKEVFEKRKLKNTVEFKKNGTEGE